MIAFSTRYIFIITIAVSCAVDPKSDEASFQTKEKGKNTYLLTHYDVLKSSSVSASATAEIENPFGKDFKLTDKELTIVREGFSRVGQCVYKVTSPHPLQMQTPDDFRAMLAKAEPLNKEQKFVPLDQVYDAMHEFRDLYGHRMPWYYNYLAMGASFLVLNGLLDIATHDAQGKAIDMAAEYMQSPEYKLKEYRFTSEGLERHTESSFSKIDSLSNKFIMETARAEHKMEELFGKVLYFGKETKIFGKTVNLNPLWALKQKSAEKLVPIVERSCRGIKSVLCLSFVVVTVSGVVSAIIPFTNFWTGKANSFLHRETEQKALQDLVGDWDNFRNFVYLKPADMKKLEKKLHSLSKKGNQDCPNTKSLADHYINPETGGFY